MKWSVIAWHYDSRTEMMISNRRLTVCSQHHNNWHQLRTTFRSSLNCHWTENLNQVNKTQVEMKDFKWWDEDEKVGTVLMMRTYILTWNMFSPGPTVGRAIEKQSKIAGYYWRSFITGKRQWQEDNIETNQTKTNEKWTSNASSVSADESRQHRERSYTAESNRQWQLKPTAS